MERATAYGTSLILNIGRRNSASMGWTMPQKSTQSQGFSAVTPRGLDFVSEGRRRECAKEDMNTDSTWHCPLPSAEEPPRFTFALNRRVKRKTIAPNSAPIRFLPAPAPPQ